MEIEDLHFLGGFNAGRRLPHIIHFAPLRRAPEIQRITLRVEMRFAEEGRHQGEKQECYKPWRIDDEACGEACHRHQVLRLAQHLPHQRHPPAGLAARPLELVLELGVFKIFQVQRCRVLHQADA